jgi:SAM-dependent methyltransferase
LKVSFRAIQAILVFSACFAAAGAATAQKPYEPTVGQEGKDVVWVPTPYALIEKMLDMARVTPQDFVMDLGSGDGRNIIAAAKRGANALGVEYNNDLVEYSRGIAQKEGVADKAKFVQGDMYVADVSKATVLALFLLTENLNRLTPNVLAMRPGSRIVVNGFRIDDWEIDETGRADGDCGSWCTAYLYIVPARVAGTWKLPQGELTLNQKANLVAGTYTANGASVPITNAKLRGTQISFTAGGINYAGRVNGDAMAGANGAWSANRVRAPGE